MAVATILTKHMAGTRVIVALDLTNNGAFRLPLFCIGRRLPTLVVCVASCIVRTNLRSVQSCCERPVLADVDQCTAMKFECTLTVVTCSPIIAMYMHDVSSLARGTTHNKKLFAGLRNQ